MNEKTFLFGMIGFAAYLAVFFPAAAYLTDSEWRTFAEVALLFVWVPIGIAGWIASGFKPACGFSSLVGSLCSTAFVVCGILVQYWL